MPRIVVDDDDDKGKRSKPRVHRIVVGNLSKTKAGWKTTYRHVIYNDTWEEFAAQYEVEEPPF